MCSSGEGPKCEGKNVHRYPVGDAALLESRIARRPAAYLMGYACERCGFVELYAEGHGALWLPKP